MVQRAGLTSGPFQYTDIATEIVYEKLVVILPFILSHNPFIFQNKYQIINKVILKQSSQLQDNFINCLNGHDQRVLRHDYLS